MSFIFIFIHSNVNILIGSYVGEYTMATSLILVLPLWGRCVVLVFKWGAFLQLMWSCRTEMGSIRSEGIWEALGVKAFGSWCPPCFNFFLLILCFFFFSPPPPSPQLVLDIRQQYKTVLLFLVTPLQGVLGFWYLSLFGSSVFSLEKLSLAFKFGKNSSWRR